MTVLLLTKRICDDLRPHLRALTDPLCKNPVQYEALRRIAVLLDKADDIRRGGVTIDLCIWTHAHLTVFRALLRDAVLVCVQMQVRRALLVRIEQIDDFLGTSAVERLGELT